MAYERYEFGTGVEVAAASGRERRGSAALSQPLFVRLDDDPLNADATWTTITACRADRIMQKAYALTPSVVQLGYLLSVEARA
jgi:hypothetical protein